MYKLQAKLALFLSAIPVGYANPVTPPERAAIPVVAYDPVGCSVEVSPWLGAYYRKVRSLEKYSGLFGTIKVPHFSEDRSRYLTVDSTQLKNRPDWDGPLDRANVYVGAHSTDHHIDAGIGWSQVTAENRSRVLVDSNQRTWEAKTNPKNWYRLHENIIKIVIPAQPWREVVDPVLKDPTGNTVATGRENIRAYVAAHELSYLFAFKPFVRTSNHIYRATSDKVTKEVVYDEFEKKNREATIYDVGDSEVINSRRQRRFHQWFNDTPFFFAPGDEVKISLTHVGSEFTLKVSSAKSDQLVWFKFFQQGFDSSEDIYSFKRVTSIDQYRMDADGTRVANEGPEVSALPTQASLVNGGWQNFYVLSQQGYAPAYTPLAKANCVNTRPRDLFIDYMKIFNVRAIDPREGRELIDITPSLR